jgi:hypothetical protein
MLLRIMTCLSVGGLARSSRGETQERLTEARLDAADGRAKMDIDNRIASKRIIETLREWILKLEDIERTGAGTTDTCEMLVCLQPDVG